jgi:hypothetical protein
MKLSAPDPEQLSSAVVSQLKSPLELQINSPVKSCQRITVPQLPLNYDHPYLLKRGLNHDWAEYMGIGEYNNKIWIAVHDLYGNFAGYVPRVLDGTTEPKYDFTGLSKTYFLYNFHRARQCKRRALIVCEGFFGTVWITQAGYPSVTGLMGTAMSELQEQYLTRYWETIIFLMDGDKAGKQAQADHIKRLQKRGLSGGVYGVNLPDNAQPDDLSYDQIRILLSAPVQ